MTSDAPDPQRVHAQAVHKLADELAPSSPTGDPPRCPHCQSDLSEVVKQARAAALREAAGVCAAKSGSLASDLCRMAAAEKGDAP